MRSQYIPKIYLSVEHPDLSTDDNKMRTSAFAMTLYRLKIKSLRTNGKYNDTSEASFILEDNEKNRNIAMQAMAFYKQECILVSDNEGFGTLLYHNGNKKEIGKLKVSNTRPKGDFTQVDSTKEYITFQ